MDTVHIGADVGSTTVKVVVLREMTPLFEVYQRHDGSPLETLISLLRKAITTFTTPWCYLALTGSQSSEYAQALSCMHVQEVIAGAVAIQKLYPTIQTAIELGGQDAKMLFFSTEQPGDIHDMRMNGVCAGGTGAFIDQIASLLAIPVEQFQEYAAKGTRHYEISGRCGVFAKTDIQPLLNQGIPREDIAYSCLHALAKQTIGGLAQGMEINAPLLLSGGPFHFIPLLKEIFQRRLKLSDEDISLPPNGQTLIAQGAALCLSTQLNHTTTPLHKEEMLTTLEHYTQEHTRKRQAPPRPFFAKTAEQIEFQNRYTSSLPCKDLTELPDTLRVYLGIDGGSTTTKFVVITEDRELIHTFYASNSGEPLRTAQKGLISFFNRMREAGKTCHIAGVGTTGYGEELFAKAFGADIHTVETMAHKEAACFYEPETSFILDLGGQDMKALFLRDGVITNMVLNEACSAGCGSFIESYSSSVGIPAQEIAHHAFTAADPPQLGSRCTVFMNSSIISEQKRGHSRGEILGGLCRSIIENLFTKVIRLSNTNTLGKKIVVQGGTFKNDAVLKAFIDYVGHDVEVIRPPLPGEMGALGIALLTRKAQRGKPSSHFIGEHAVRKLTWRQSEENRCGLCSNACLRTIITFCDGTTFIKGNRCPRGEEITPTKQEKRRVPNGMNFREKLLLKRRTPPAKPKKHVGIPLVLDFYETLPFWETLFTRLGYAVHVSGRSSYPLFEKGLQDIPSDTACFPAKLVHGHLHRLAEKGVDCIFLPRMLKNLPAYTENKASWNCAVLQGYPELVKTTRLTTGDTKEVPLISPAFKWTNKRLYRTQIIRFFKETFGEPKKAVLQALSAAEDARKNYEKRLREFAHDVEKYAEETGTTSIVMAGRPYHGDQLVNHRVADLFTAMGIAVLIPENLPRQPLEPSTLRIDLTNNYHTRLFHAAHYTITTPRTELVQLVSFGCGHDAIYSDELQRILFAGAQKTPLILKIDESDAHGPLKIRITSFIESLRARKQLTPSQHIALPHPFSPLFTKKDRDRKILIPNLSKSFSYLLSEAIRKQGYTPEIVPMATRRAIDLGKKYVHNDICFPAQINIGEHLHWLETNPHEAHRVAAVFAKNCQDCRAGHYAALGRKAFDEAGFSHTPVATTEFSDTKINPGFRVNTLQFNLFTLHGLALIDALDDMLYKCRPYAASPSEVDNLHDRMLTTCVTTLRTRGFSPALKKLATAVSAFNDLATDRRVRKKRVGIIGEILVNFHPASNYGIVPYLEENNLEVVLPSLIEFWRQDAINWKTMAERGHTRAGKLKALQGSLYEGMFGHVIGRVEKQMRSFKYYEPHSDIRDIAARAAQVMDISYRTGEGWLMPGEILSWMDAGIGSFLILQPFGCLPNHITGKGLIQRLKKRAPHSTILSLDFDPDSSIANIHNRLQMLILNS
ncbi:acyl-CoA dehydratase activase [Chitinivibrio alkaliphilus]|uniref:CoA-substrate-specific enzyme activase n=1 Tax=Chitinivibrio alkaliphilus ACht1 TaxID=1313304 RepID=U7DA63_9BACT|nr:acyl-CoA dehydratase activase [Chitinivibrio alkaliphilus]ERP38907.1 CoA-substrate-specific enzyme activase [Chitinivibrio alkaliphilus ACht1]